MHIYTINPSEIRKELSYRRQQGPALLLLAPSPAGVCAREAGSPT